MVRALWLHHHQGPPTFAGGLPGVVGVGDDAALGRGDADRGQQLLGERLLPADVLADGRGAVRLGAAHPALMDAVTQLQQAALIEPPHGNAAPQRRVRDGARVGAQQDVAAKFLQAFEFCGEIVWACPRLPLGWRRERR